MSLPPEERSGRDDSARGRPVTRPADTGDFSRDTPHRDTFDQETGRSDEVSLRDLFLVLLRGLPFILLLALVCGGVAYYLNAQRQAVFAAESTVLVTPPPIQTGDGENLSFSPINEVSFQIYETLARSQPVLRGAVESLSEVNLSPAQLLGLGTLRQLFGPRLVGDVAPLSVVHRVRNADPERAALLADAWAQSTLQAVRESLFSSLSPVDETTTREVARLQGDVEEVEARVQTFAARDNGALLEAELEGLTRQLTDGRERQGELAREIAAARARVQALQAQLGAARGVQSGEVQASEVQGREVRSGAALSPALLGVLNAQRTLSSTEDTMRARSGFTPSAQLARTFSAALAESDTLSALLAGNETEFVSLARRLYSEAVRTLEDALARGQRLERRTARERAQGTLELALLGYASAQQAPGNPQAPTNPQAPNDPARNIPEAAGSQNTQTQSLQPQSAQTYDALTLLTQAELRREQVALQGMIAERASLGGEIASYTRSAATIQQRLATLEQRRSRLERELENVLASYATVAELQSSVSYLTELAPTNARILSQASVPTTPVGPRRTFNTVLAAVLGGLVGTVLVFLRAAVRPRAPLRKAHL